MLDRRSIAVFCLVGTFSARVVSVHAQEADKSGMSPSRMKLPKGPGSIEGTGENAEPNLAQGLVTWGYPIAVPAGYEQATPSIRLAYSSGSGNSEVGIGWAVSAPSIERMTSKGLPKYSVDDLFAAGGSDELVRVDTTTGIYRARYEGSFVRYQWVDQDKKGKAGYFKAEYPDGRVGYYGATVEGVIEPTARVEGPTGTFRYHLVDMVDPLGHVLRYEYLKDGSYSLLKRISYAFQEAENRNPRYQVLFSYENRLDHLSDAKPGFDVRLTQRLKGIQVLVQGNQLRRYALRYRTETVDDHLSLLAGIQQYGIGDAGPYPIDFQFTYSNDSASRCVAINCRTDAANTCPETTCQSDGASDCTATDCQFPQLVTLDESLGVDFSTGKADLIDINGDGLPDVVDTTLALHRFLVNHLDQNGKPSFKEEVASKVGSLQLDQPSAQTVDLNGDGFTDLVDTNTGNGSARVLWNNGVGEWTDAGPVSNLGLPNFAEAQNLRFFDYNNDKKIDLLFNDGSNAFVYVNQGALKFVVSDDIEPIGQPFSQLQLADMNGDGLQDPVELAYGIVAYKLNLGWGRWSGWIEMDNAPDVAAGIVRLVDINGDGLSDVVTVQADKLRYQLNRDGRSFGTEVTKPVDAMPSKTEVRFADMNGNGSTDIVWIPPSEPVKFYELYPVRPNLISSIQSGIGKVIELSYGSSVRHMEDARRAGKPWQYRLPNPSTTLDTIITHDTLTKVKQTRRLAYSDGYYDGTEKQFRGFEAVTVTTEGDETAEPGVVSSKFDVGRSDSYRKALLLAQSVTSNGRELHAASNDYQECVVSGIAAQPATPVRHVCQKSATNVIKEGLASGEWVTTVEESAWDGYGNRTKVTKHGVVSIGGKACGPCERADGVNGAPCGDSCLGDESISETKFVSPENTGGRWILNRAAQSLTYGRAGGAKKEKNYYYDGDPLTDIEPGKLTVGLLAKTEERLDATSFVKSERYKYDSNGNPVASWDPNGNERHFAYDAVGLHLVAEEVLFKKATPAYSLKMTAEYDPLHEQIIESSAWMRYEGDQAKSEPRSSYYDYDKFARLTKIAKPGDSLDDPTEEYAYELSNPVSRIVRRARSQSGAAPDVMEVQCFDGLGRKYQTRSLIDGSNFQVSGYTLFDHQGNAAISYQPYGPGSDRCDVAAPAKGNATKTKYDATQRAHEVTLPDGSMSKTAYAPLRVAQYDPEDLDEKGPHHDTPEVTFTDGLGRTTAIDRYLAPATPTRVTVTYDELSHLRGYVQIQGTTKIEKIQTYDLLGRVNTVSDPDSHDTSFSYDPAGNVLTETDARQIVTVSTYDEANRVVTHQQQGDAKTLVTYQYDATTGCTGCTHLEGMLAKVTYPMGTGQGEDAVGYDLRGQPVYSRRTLDGHVFEITSTLDNLGRVTARSFPNGTSISYNLDGLGRLKSVPGYIPSVNYDDRGLPKTQKLANGVVTDYVYDQLMRLEKLSTVSPVAGKLQDYVYTRDRVGNITTITDTSDFGDAPSANATYHYDPWYRLVGADLDVGRVPEEHLTYAYNELDNITAKKSDAGSKSPEHVGDYKYGESGAGPHAVTSAGEMTLKYDEAGNMTLHGQDTYKWDYQGRLYQATRGNEVLGDYTYGAGRDRVKKVEDGHVAYYVAPDFEVRDGVAIVYVTVGDRKVVKIEDVGYAAKMFDDVAPGYEVDGQYVATPDGVTTAGDGWVAEYWGSNRNASQPANLLGGLAMKSSSSMRQLSENLLEYLHSDNLDNVSSVTSADGTNAARSQNYPYGTPRSAILVGFGSYTITGKEYDKVSELAYFGSRYYAPRIATWAGPDAVFHVLDPEHRGSRMPEATNRLVYAARNPINTRDANGKWVERMLGVIVGSNNSETQTKTIVEIERFAETSGSTISHIRVNGKDMGYVLEPGWQDNRKGISRIPAGTYSAAFAPFPQNKPKYLAPLLLGTGTREGIRLHIGNWTRGVISHVYPEAPELNWDEMRKGNTEGCQLIGKKYSRDPATGDFTVEKSGKAFHEIMGALLQERAKHLGGRYEMEWIVKDISSTSTEGSQNATAKPTR